MRFTIAGVYPPEQVTVYGSTNDKDYIELGSLNQNDLSRIQGRNKIKHQLLFDPVRLSSIKLVAKNVSPIPEGHHRAGENSAIKVDEIVVN